MRGLSSMCKINPESAACNHWQREVCGRCPDWQFDGDHKQGSTAHKLMTNDECQRLKRELQASLFRVNGGINPMTLLLLLFFMVFCMCIIVWLLAKAFVFKKPPKHPAKRIEVCQDRQSGGQASVDDIVQQLREKYSASAKMLSSAAGKTDAELYVPTRFWDTFPMNGFGKKSKSLDQHTQAETKLDIDKELETEASDESSDIESSESLVTDVLKTSDEAMSDSSEETTSSTGEQLSERSTAAEDQTSITMDIQQEARKCHPAIGKMPTSYGPTATTNQSNAQSRGKIRWANWLRRGKRDDYQV